MHSNDQNITQAAFCSRFGIGSSRADTGNRVVPCVESICKSRTSAPSAKIRKEGQGHHFRLNAPLELPETQPYRSSALQADLRGT